MEFENQDAKNLFIELSQKYGLRHVNSDEAISLESLRELEKQMIKFIEEDA